MSSQSLMDKIFKKQFKLIRAESIELEKSAQDAIVFLNSQSHDSVIIGRGVSFIFIAKLTCYTV